MGAEAVEAGNLQFGSTVAMRLNKILFHNQQNNTNITLDRLALYFTQGLLQKCFHFTDDQTNSCNPMSSSSFTSSFQILFQEISPYLKFAHFTANQAILELITSSTAHGHQQQQQLEIHVIDFDIMQGIQWPSFMVDLVTSRQDISLRITAAIFYDLATTTTVQQTGFRLQEFASSINLPFSFDQILFGEDDVLEQIIIQPEEAATSHSHNILIANICMVNLQLHVPVLIQQLKIFLNILRKLSPKAVILVEEELYSMSTAPFMSFVEFSSEALKHYTAMSDSLLTGFSKAAGGYKFAQRLVEKEFFGARILDCLSIFPCGKENRNQWKENYPSMYGFTPIPISSYNVTQAKHLISLFDGSGYWVQHEQQSRLTLGWKLKALTTASVWVPTKT